MKNLWNLKVKLKRLKITIDDIQIVDTPIKKKQEDIVQKYQQRIITLIN